MYFSIFSIKYLNFKIELLLFIFPQAIYNVFTYKFSFYKFENEKLKLGYIEM